MSPNLLLPLHVDACVVPTQRVAVGLREAPFGPGSVPLAPGVHVHWALPDCLTRAVAQKSGDMILPAVPDRYLVVRLNPPTTGPRTFRVWCVDARTRQMGPVGPWAPVPAGPRPWLTALGELPEGVVVGDPSDPLFDGAYAPASLGRFALHDPLDDLPPDPQGLSYFVLGTYARQDEDPLFRAGLGAATPESQDRRRARWCADNHLQVTGLEALNPPPVVVHTPVQGPLLAPAIPPAWMAGTAAHIAGVLLAPFRVTPLTLRFATRLVCHGACYGVGSQVPGPPADVPRVAVYRTARAAAIEVSGDNAVVRAGLSGVGDLETSSGLARLAELDHAADFLAHPGATPEDARFFRAASPVVTVQGVGRLFRHGEDGRFDAQGKPLEIGRLRARTGDEVVTLIKAEAHKSEVERAAVSAAASDLVTGDLPGQPDWARTLLREAALLDPEGLDRLTAVALGTARLDPSWTVRVYEALKARLGDAHAWAPGATINPAFDAPPPAPLALQRYVPVFQPLFAEVEVELRPALAAGATGLPASQVLAAPDWVPEPATPALAPIRWQARRPLTASVADLMTRLVKVPEVERADLLCASLTGFDDALAQGNALRTGDLCVIRLRIIDLFGRTQDLVAQGAGLPGVATQLTVEALPPRLTSWARLHFRFAEQDAVCGFLRPDHVDHALEFYDGAGQALGQLEARGDQVRWTPAPLAREIDGVRPLTDPRRVVPAACTELLGLIDALHHPEGEARVDGHTAFSALARVIEAARAATRRDQSTVAPLFGRPVALVRASVRLETRPAGTENPNQFVGVVPTPTGLRVALGDVQSGDGLFGYFVGPDFSALHIGGWVAGRPNHPFVSGPPTIALPPAGTGPLTLLMDPLATVQAATGVQPVKAISLPTAWIEPALRALRPSLPFGPLLLPGGEAHLPPPHAPGLAWRWVRRIAHDGGLDALTLPLKSADPSGLRDGAVLAEEGWFIAALEDAQGASEWPAAAVRIRTPNRP